jgi:hypothetical protein
MFGTGAVSRYISGLTKMIRLFAAPSPQHWKGVGAFYTKAQLIFTFTYKLRKIGQNCQKCLNNRYYTNFEQIFSTIELF